MYKHTTDCEGFKRALLKPVTKTTTYVRNHEPRIHRAVLTHNEGSAKSVEMLMDSLGGNVPYNVKGRLNKDQKRREGKKIFKQSLTCKVQFRGKIKYYRRIYKTKRLKNTCYGKNIEYAKPSLSQHTFVAEHAFNCVVATASSHPMASSPLLVTGLFFYNDVLWVYTKFVTTEMTKFSK